MTNKSSAARISWVATKEMASTTLGGVIISLSQEGRNRLLCASTGIDPARQFGEEPVAGSSDRRVIIRLSVADSEDLGLIRTEIDSLLRKKFGITTCQLETGTVRIT